MSEPFIGMEVSELVAKFSDPNESREEFILRMQQEGFVPSYPGPNELQLDIPARHIRIQLPWELTDWERIAWQAALGSDPVRELLSCLRLRKGDAHPTMLIEPKDAR